MPNYTPAEIRDQVAVPLSQVAAEITTLLADLQSLDAQGAVPGRIVTLRLSGARDAVADLQNFALVIQGKVRAAKNGSLIRQFKKNQTMQRLRENRDQLREQSEEKPAGKTVKKTRK